MADTIYQIPGRTIKRSFIAITLIFFLILAGFAWVVHDINTLSRDTVELTKENQERILDNQERLQDQADILKDIQDSRIQSCQQTYTGIYEVFVVFFPPSEKRTKEEQDNIDRFTTTIDNFKAGCAEQTGQEGG